VAVNRGDFEAKTRDGMLFAITGTAYATESRLVRESRRRTYIDFTARVQRSMIGIKPDGTIIFMTVDAFGVRTGVRFPEGVDIFDSMRGVNTSEMNILNLDGGSSTQMFFNGRMVTTPQSGGNFAPVGSVFKVF